MPIRPSDPENGHPATHSYYHSKVWLCEACHDMAAISEKHKKGWVNDLKRRT